MKNRYLCSLRMVVRVLYQHKECRRAECYLTAAILHDPSDAEPVSEEKKATFYAAAELDVRCLFLELETKS